MVFFSVEKDVEKCRHLWQLFSPEKSLFDIFDYRFSIYDPKYFELHFLVWNDENGPKGMVPLWRSLQDDSYEFFGGYFTERNRFFVKDKRLIPLLLSNLPERTCLSYIESSEAAFAPLVQSETRYFIDLQKYGHSLESYLSSFNGKHRKNLRHDLQKLSCCTVHHNRLHDYNRMAELNVIRFGDDSFFKEKYFFEGFLRFMELARKRGELRMISIEHSGIVQAVEIAVQYKDEYYVLMVGTNTSVSNIGKFLTLEHIKNAIRNKARIVDFLSTDSGWKRLWKLSEEPVYYYANYNVEPGLPSLSKVAKPMQYEA